MRSDSSFRSWEVDGVVDANFNSQIKPNCRLAVRESQRKASQFTPQISEEAPNFTAPSTCQPRCSEGLKTERLMGSLCKQLCPTLNGVAQLVERRPAK